LGAALDSASADILLVDPSLERVLTLGRQINDLLYKIGTATKYISQGSPDSFEVEAARRELIRDLSRDRAEAREHLPSLDEIVSKLEEEGSRLESARMVNAGLARIEGINGTGKQKEFVDAAAAFAAKESEVHNLIKALGALERDIRSARTHPHVCPNCSHAGISYRITPSDLGYTLFRCDRCGNAWRIVEYSVQPG
jgi:DNA-directed RNA polymerase subunit M/transcription elongation factor TFIIS